MLGLRMLQLLCRLPIKLHSHYMRINVRFGSRQSTHFLAIAFEDILIRHNTQYIMVMKLTPGLEETTVQGIDMKCFLIGSSVMCFCHFIF